MARKCRHRHHKLPHGREQRMVERGIKRLKAHRFEDRMFSHLPCYVDLAKELNKE